MGTQDQDHKVEIVVRDATGGGAIFDAPVKISRPRRQRGKDATLLVEDKTDRYGRFSHRTFARHLLGRGHGLRETV